LNSLAWFNQPPAASIRSRKFHVFSGEPAVAPPNATFALPQEIKTRKQLVSLKEWTATAGNRGFIW
jgi:hypothetical protein